MKIAVITGASSGMGREFAVQISKKYRTLDEIWVLARSRDKLLTLADEIEGITIRVFACDITKNNDLSEFKAALNENKPELRILVNAAGFGVIGQFDELSEEDNVGMVDLNCQALTKMTSLCLPYMTGSISNIINIASSAAFVPQPSFAVYAASKSYVLSLSRALSKELKSRNIYVTAVCPGPVDTAFFDKAEKLYEVKLYKKMLRAKAPKVVGLALRDAYHGSSISVYGISMKAFRILCKVLPHSLIIKFIN